MSTTKITLKQNTAGFTPGRRGTVPRESVALLQGRVLCGICGTRMRIKYQQIEAGIVPYYQCCEEVVRRAGKLCQSIRGSNIDGAISGLLVEAVAPAALEVALAVQDEIAGRIEAAAALRRSQLELARRRYLKVDPDNRLVADTLEADWNDRLRRFDILHQEHEQQRKADQGLLNDEAREHILALSTDFPCVWNNPRTQPLERKQMLALLIEDVTLIKSAQITMHVRFRGGRTTSLSVERPKPVALVRKTLPDVIKRLDQLLETCTDRQASQKLNVHGHRNWKGQPFTSKRVRYVRQVYGLKSRFNRLRARGFLTGEEMANKPGICVTSVHQLGREGVLPRQLYGNEQRCLYAPLDGARFQRGRGGRCRSKRPKLIPASTSTREAI